MPAIKHHRLVIGVPVYNEARFLRSCLESLATQTDNDFAVLVADNASTDGSDIIAKAFSEKYKNFYFIQHERNLGSATNFVYLLEKTDSPFFQWLGSHDFLDNNYIRLVMAEFIRRPAASLVYTKTQWVDEHGNYGSVTSGGNFDSSETTMPLSRYIDTVSGPWKECTAVNGVFRRCAVRGTRPHRFRRPDHLILTRTQFFGPVSHIGEPMYCRRRFGTRETTQSSRLSGDENKAPLIEKTVWPLIFWQTKNYFDLPCGVWQKIVKLPHLLIALARGNANYLWKYIHKSIRLLR